ncbi:flavin-containing monooxygenase [Arthrobacter ramosus]|uniref:Flavin-containing monooxygenase n=1 Tax=Arthrobacter ramosus TaxID=1672 RepID=A0ABV5Y5H8_ARTRM|nr:NAD(P)/FAD-dependent oxidoreductase [Arthrobacter ramosus]
MTTSATTDTAVGTTSGKRHFDAIIVGAGFAGLNALHKLRDEMGLDVHVFEAAPSVGGVWHWNRYPGARTDSESWYYGFTFSEELYQEWTWSQRNVPQAELQRYFNHVADRFDFRRSIEFETVVVGAKWDDGKKLWSVTLRDGRAFTCKYLISAMGFFSEPKIPKLPGREDFAGRVLVTAEWPAEGVDLTGRRVGVVGTGASGVQLIPVIAPDVETLTVFQRTPGYTIPGQNFDISESHAQQLKESHDEIRRLVRNSVFAAAIASPGRVGHDKAEAERLKVWEAGWQGGGFKFILDTFDDMMVSQEVNDSAAEFIRSKIREIVKDPEVAEMLSPRDYPFNGKRPPVGHGYYETYNRPNVKLVNLRADPLRHFTESGLVAGDVEYRLDDVIFATGFDAITGGLLNLDVHGINGVTLGHEWSKGPHTFMGVAVSGFPNLFMISGPQSPSANLPACIDDNVDLIGRVIAKAIERGASTVEVSGDAQENWNDITSGVFASTVLATSTASTWMAGPLVPGEERHVNVYLGGANNYFDATEREVAAGLPSFTFA